MSAWRTVRMLSTHVPIVILAIIISNAAAGEINEISGKANINELNNAMNSATKWKWILTVAADFGRKDDQANDTQVNLNITEQDTIINGTLERYDKVWKVWSKETTGGATLHSVLLLGNLANGPFDVLQPENRTREMMFTIERQGSGESVIHSMTEIDKILKNASNTPITLHELLKRVNKTVESLNDSSNENKTVMPMDFASTGENSPLSNTEIILLDEEHTTAVPLLNETEQPRQDVFENQRTTVISLVDAIGNESQVITLQDITEVNQSSAETTRLKDPSTTSLDVAAIANVTSEPEIFTSRLEMPDTVNNSTTNVLSDHNATDSNNKTSSISTDSTTILADLTIDNAPVNGTTNKTDQSTATIPLDSEITNVTSDALSSDLENVSSTKLDPSNVTISTRPSTTSFTTTRHNSSSNDLPIGDQEMLSNLTTEWAITVGNITSTSDTATTILTDLTIDKAPVDDQNGTTTIPLDSEITNVTSDAVFSDLQNVSSTTLDLSNVTISTRPSTKSFTTTRHNSSSDLSIGDQEMLLNPTTEWTIAVDNITSTSDTATTILMDLTIDNAPVDGRNGTTNKTVDQSTTTIPLDSEITNVTSDALSSDLQNVSSTKSDPSNVTISTRPGTTSFTTTRPNSSSDLSIDGQEMLLNPTTEWPIPMDNISLISDTANGVILNELNRSTSHFQDQSNVTIHISTKLTTESFITSLNSSSDLSLDDEEMFLNSTTEWAIPLDNISSISDTANLEELNRSTSHFEDQSNATIHIPTKLTTESFITSHNSSSDMSLDDEEMFLNSTTRWAIPLVNISSISDPEVIGTLNELNRSTSKFNEPSTTTISSESDDILSTVMNTEDNVTSVVTLETISSQVTADVDSADVSTMSFILNSENTFNSSKDGNPDDNSTQVASDFPPFNNLSMDFDENEFTSISGSKTTTEDTIRVTSTLHVENNATIARLKTIPTTTTGTKSTFKYFSTTLKPYFVFAHENTKHPISSTIGKTWNVPNSRKHGSKKSKTNRKGGGNRSFHQLMLELKAKELRRRGRKMEDEENVTFDDYNAKWNDPTGNMTENETIRYFEWGRMIINLTEENGTGAPFSANASDECEAAWQCDITKNERCISQGGRKICDCGRAFARNSKSGVCETFLFSSNDSCQEKKLTYCSPWAVCIEDSSKKSGYYCACRKYYLDVSPAISIYPGEVCDGSCMDYCESNGVCIIKDGDILCSCPLGYAGFHCEFFVLSTSLLLTAGILSASILCCILPAVLACWLRKCGHFEVSKKPLLTQSYTMRPVLNRSFFSS